MCHMCIKIWKFSIVLIDLFSPLKAWRKGLVCVHMKFFPAKRAFCAKIALTKTIFFDKPKQIDMAGPKIWGGGSQEMAIPDPELEKDP